MKNNIIDILEQPEKYMVQAGGEYEIISELGFLRSITRYKGERYIIYGAGVRCNFLIWWLEMEGVSVEFIVDADTNKNNTMIRGIKVYSCENVPDDIEKQNITALISVGSFKDNIEEIVYNLSEIGIKKIIYAFDKKYGLPDYRYEWNEFYYKEKVKILKLYDSLADDESRDVLCEFIKMNVTNCAYKGNHNKTRNKYDECYVRIANESYLNIGGCVGDNVFTFVENRNEVFGKIIVVESDNNTYKRLIKNLEILPPHIRKKVETVNMFMNQESGDCFESERITLISMDIEGAELEALQGLQRCIYRNRPVLAICAYHKPQDIVELPDIVQKTVSNYKIFFRKYAPSYNSHLRSGELVMYAVPEERIEIN